MTLEEVKFYFSRLRAWIVERFGEFSTWNGAYVLLLSITVFLFSSLAKFVAWIGVPLGLYLIWKKESKE
jgi:hypothetical protein